MTWREMLCDPKHPIWSFLPGTARTLGLSASLFLLQTQTATQYDLDGEGLTLALVTVGKALEEAFWRR